MKAEVRRKITYPYNIDYICSAYPPRTGYLTVKKENTTYALYNIGPDKNWELVFPPQPPGSDGWITECRTHWIEPDLIMIDDLTYTTYIKLI